VKQNLSEPSTKAVAFFIGGAADKVPYYGIGPLHLMREVKDLFEKKVQGYIDKDIYHAFYCGFDEVIGEKNIRQHILRVIPDKQTLIYIIGLSLGGWNGAHLARILTEKGYCVKGLITLDPVGKGMIAFWISDIYREEPTPQAEFWINVRALPSRPNISDGVAWAGAKWIMLTGPHINSYVDTNHMDADQLFFSALEGKQSAADWMVESIRQHCS
jgi:hypothetical protein